MADVVRVLQRDVRAARERSDHPVLDLIRADRGAESDRTDPSIGAELLDDASVAVVVARVVDAEDLEVRVRLGQQPLEAGVDPGTRVVHRHDDADQIRVGGRRRRAYELRNRHAIDLYLWTASPLDSSRPQRATGLGGAARWSERHRHFAADELARRAGVETSVHGTSGRRISRRWKNCRPRAECSRARKPVPFVAHRLHP
jgi:hypothetical protein